MNPIPDTHESPTAKVARELAKLKARVEEERATLARLQQDVADAETRRGSNRAVQLREANERLVLAALRAQSDADMVKRTLNEVSRSAELDVLTKLPNRVLLLDRFERAIASAKRHNTRVALLFLDLNNFKQINDTLGHAVGDQVLKLVAHRLASSVRKADTVSRHGGDEFLILLTDVTEASDAGRFASKVIAALDAPSCVGEHVLRLTASIGISLYPDDGDDADKLLDRADAAMYCAKRHGLGSYVFHGDEPLRQAILKRPALTSLQDNSSHYEHALDEHERRHSQLREANEQLVLTALSAQELKSAEEQAQRRQAKLVATLASKLRKPLAPIRAAVSLLGRESPNGQMLSEVRAVIERQVAHMSRLVGDLIDASRVNSGDLRLERRVVEMAGIIEAAVDACRPAMDTRLQRFSAQVPSRSLEVQGDPVGLTHVLSSLLDNVSKRTSVGGEIALSIGLDGDAIVMRVSDGVTGIAAEAMSKSFEPGMPATHAVGFNEVSCEPDLALVREWVEAHEGKLRVSSAGSGLGNQFVVTLPLNRATAARQR